MLTRRNRRPPWLADIPYEIRVMTMLCLRRVFL